MAATDDSLHKPLVEKHATVNVEGNFVRALKVADAPKTEINAAIETLNALKLEKMSIEHSLIGCSDTREAFRQPVVNTLEQRLFYIPSFKIYLGVTGLFDYGPPGYTVKLNVLSFWRPHFILEENMLEVDCLYVTPEVVLKASGHVDKFTDLIINNPTTKSISSLIISQSLQH